MLPSSVFLPAVLFQGRNGVLQTLPSLHDTEAASQLCILTVLSFTAVATAQRLPLRNFSDLQLAFCLLERQLKFDSPRPSNNLRGDDRVVPNNTIITGTGGSVFADNIPSYLCACGAEDYFKSCSTS